MYLADGGNVTDQKSIQTLIKKIRIQLGISTQNSIEVAEVLLSKLEKEFENHKERLKTYIEEM